MINNENMIEKYEVVKLKNIFKLLKSLVLVGLSVITFICRSWCNFYGEYTKKEFYGGDAYTGIQNATADASRNISELGNFIEYALQDCFLICGILFLAFGILGIIESIINIKRSNVRINRLKYESNEIDERDHYEKNIEKIYEFE